MFWKTKPSRLKFLWEDRSQPHWQFIWSYLLMYKSLLLVLKRSTKCLERNKHIKHHESQPLHLRLLLPSVHLIKHSETSLNFRRGKLQCVKVRLVRIWSAGIQNVSWFAHNWAMEAYTLIKRRLSPLLELKYLLTFESHGLVSSSGIQIQEK